MMMRPGIHIKLFATTVILLTLTGCGVGKMAIKEIQFDAGPCYGSCPVFKMSVSADGSASYQAKIFNRDTGYFITVIKKSSLDSLCKLVAKANVPQLKNEYSVNASDFPAYTLYVSFKNGTAKTIADYGPSGPPELKAVYEKIFSLREYQDWRRK
jgi:hypothetical protein